MAARTPRERATGARVASARGPRAGQTSQSYVLHRYDWSESSLILDLFTREQGRIAVAAKGAKRPYSQLRGVLLPFQRLQVSLGRMNAGDAAAAEVQTLRGAEWAGGAAMLTGAALFSGFYLNELLMKLTARHDPHPALFDFYAATLEELAPTAGIDAPDDVRSQAALRAFELALLRETGLLPDLSLLTQTQQPVQPEQRYGLSAEGGVIASSEVDASLSGDALVSLQAALLHGNPAALQQACRPALVALKTLLRGMVQHQLGATPLRTRQVMAGLQGL